MSKSRTTLRPDYRRSSRFPVVRAPESTLKQAITEWVNLQRAGHDEALGVAVGLALQGVTGNGLNAIAKDNVARLLFGLVQLAAVNVDRVLENEPP